MTRFLSKLNGFAVVVLVGLMPAQGFAAKSIKIRALLADSCSNCSTDIANPDPLDPGMKSYSVRSDGSDYDNSTVQSTILTNNSVYTLDTTGTLVNGQVGPGTRTTVLHFYSPVEGQFPGHVLPPCWQGEYDQNQAVNWSIFSSDVTFPNMVTGQSYGGFARMNFNVRNGVCDAQVYRFELRWYNVCITRTSATGWDVTSDSCGRQTNYGEAILKGQGGRKSETVVYGDWRLPFNLNLTVE